MSSLSCNEEVELLMITNNDNWASMNSIRTQAITKLTRSEARLPQVEESSGKLSSNISLKELELNEWTQVDEASNKAKTLIEHQTQYPDLFYGRSWVRDEKNLLKINLSEQDKVVPFNQTGFTLRNNRKTWRKFVNWINLWKSCAKKKMQDLVAEIEDSESAKKDLVPWKFLKRRNAITNELLNGQTYLPEIQEWLTKDVQIKNNEPLRLTCPNCTFFITTKTKKVSTLRTRMASMAFAIVGLCVTSNSVHLFNNTVHLCPLCRIYLGFYPSMGEYDLKKYRDSRCRPKPELQKAKMSCSTMVSASSTSAKNLFVESKLRLSDRVQVNVNNIAAIARQIQRGSKANENLIAAAKNFALQEAAIENSETNLKKLRLLTTHLSTQIDSLQNNSSKVEEVLEQVRSMQR